MRKLKQALSLSLALVLSLALAVPAFAADPSFEHFTFSTDPLGTAVYDYFGENSSGEKIWIRQFTVVVLPDDSSYTVKLEDCGLFYWDEGNVSGLGEGCYGNIFDVSGIDYGTYEGPYAPGADFYGNGTFKVDESHYTWWGILSADEAELEQIIVMSETCAMKLPYEDIKAAALQALNGGSEQPSTNITVDPIPASGTAYASTQTVTVDGKAVEFQMYALKDENGNDTNYIKLRDMAYILSGTDAQFSVGYDGTVTLTTGEAYQAAGTEMTTPYSGDRSYTGGAQTVKIDGQDVSMTAITLTDDNGGGYTYFKLRDLGTALGFYVGWSAEAGVFVESGRPAEPA